MKGRKGCYSEGGRIRNLGGIKAHAYGANPKVIGEAKGKTTGVVGEGGIGTDGVPVKSNLGRPGRKAKGGRC